MLRYALARLVWTIPVVFVAVTLTFFLVRSIGGDPFRHGPLVGLTAQGGWQKYGDYQPQSIRDNMRRRYGLDLPWYEQYGNYLVGVATLNLGPSLSYRNRTVEEIIAEQGPVTLELALLALGLAFALGIPIGLLSALHSRSPVASLERVSSSLALSLPAFFVGTILIYVFALQADLVPTTGWDSWSAKILPVVTLSLVPLAYCVRLTRGAVLETLTHDYVRTARSKGLRRGRLLGVHVLRNSLVPVLSAVGPLLGAMMTTLFVVEVVFAVPGLARHYVSATTASDYPLLLGMTVVLTLFVITANLLVDLALAALDPRRRD
jgi:oligopeptide transport system permease protein